MSFISNQVALVKIMLCIVFINAFLVATVNAQTISNLSAAQWREDLHYLAEEMPRIHKNLFHITTRERFNSAVENLNRRIPLLSRDQLIVEMARIVALVGDGHTRMGLIPNRIRRDEKIGFNNYPLKLYLYKDGLFVQSASQEYSRAVGGKVVKIGNVSAEQAFRKVSEITFRDNEWTVKDRAPYMLTTPEILQSLGIISDKKKAQFMIEKEGQQISLELQPIAQDTDVNWVDARDTSKNSNPLWLKSPKDYLWVRNPKDYYWFEYLPDSRIIYLQFNVVQNKPEESFADFCKKVFAFAEANPVDKFVIDLRRNSGGSSELMWALIYGLIRSDKINQYGKLFTIVGRRTFSAAMNCADALERHTKTIFVGEPTGSRPNHYGDAQSIILPNSGIYIDVSTLFHQESGALDSREWIAPEIAADLTSQDYQANVDPAMQIILNYIPEKSLAEKMMEAFNDNNDELAIKYYRDYKKSPLRIYADTENVINNLGYKLLRIKKMEQAIRVFNLNVESYPVSWNAYDSLAGAYAANGNKELAVKNYEKSLQLNPLNIQAKESLKTLREEKSAN